MLFVALACMLAAGLSYAISTGIADGINGYLGIGLAKDLAFGFENGIESGLAIGVVIGLATSAVWPAFLASVQLALKWKTPVHLIRFLEDAHKRSVLRTVGPCYQFRHARLQDRLATETFRSDPVGERSSQAVANSTTGQVQNNAAPLFSMNHEFGE
jgi:hypothetical protein